MAYRALYRAYRPKNFDEVSGQEHIIKILRNQILKNKLAHAYVFNGPRGTGKTSVAKIFAKAINCKDPKKGNPCDECETCLSDEIDIIEIDAASNNSVDNIRGIREKVILLPAISKYKIYIIDEVHMLSAGAFNALLKTLEEPPGHIIFILATTELRKLPSTILSRCQRFDFARISAKTIFDRLVKICSQENISYEENAVMQIAVYAEGGMRDAISMLDQVSNVSDKVTLNDVLSSIGGINTDTLIELAMGICSYSETTVSSQLSTLVSNGQDCAIILKELIKLFRDMLSCSFLANKQLLNYYDNEEVLEKLGREFGKNNLLRAIDILLLAENQIKFSSQPEITLLTTLFRIMTPEAQPSDERARIEKLEFKLNELIKKGGIKEQPVSISDQKDEKKKVKEIKVKKQDIKAYDDILAEIKEHYPLYLLPLKSCKCLKLQDGILELLLCGEQIIPDILKSQMFSDIIAQIGEKLFNQRIELVLKTQSVLTQSSDFTDIVIIDS